MPYVILSLYLVMSIVTFLAFAWDKRAAQTDSRRVSERRLHMLEALGGWPGAILGQYLLRHKSLKFQYRIVLWGIIALHVTLWCATAYLLWL